MPDYKLIDIDGRCVVETEDVRVVLSPGMIIQIELNKEYRIRDRLARGFGDDRCKFVSIYTGAMGPFATVVDKLDSFTRLKIW